MQQTICEELYPSILFWNEGYLLGTLSGFYLKDFKINNRPNKAQTAQLTKFYIGKSWNKLNILSSKINRQTRLFSSKVNNNATQINPGFVSGFIDGEGSFSITILKDKEYKCGWRVKAVFSIGLHIKDEILLKNIQNFFGPSVGKIYKIKSDLLQYRVFSEKDLLKVLKHLEQFPLLTQKQADYELFKQAFEIIKMKQHLELEGIKKLVAIKGSMNNGLSDELKVSFSDVIPVKRPLVENQIVLDPHWLAGFTSAEGCFMIIITDSSAYSTGSQVQIKFILTQHSRDEQLFKSFIVYFGCGKLNKRNKNAVDFVVARFSDIENKILPFFKNYPILGIKSKDFDDWCKVVEIMKDRKHLTKDGLEQIRKIKTRMNRARDLKAKDGEDSDDETPSSFSDITPLRSSSLELQAAPAPQESTIDNSKVKILLNYDNSQVTKSWGFSVLWPFGPKDKDQKNSHNNYNFINSFIHTYFNIQLIYFSFHWTNLYAQINHLSFRSLVLRYFSLYKKFSISDKNNALNSVSPINSCAYKTLFGNIESKKYYSTFSNTYSAHGLKTQAFNEWLGGLIDGDGQFHYTKKGLASLKIIMDIKDKKALYEIKHKYGGTIKTMAGSNSLKYKLKHPKNLIQLIYDINGHIRNPIRMLQLNKICVKFYINFKIATPLTYNNGWFSGFIDSDGSIYIDEKSGQLILSVTQKNKYLLEPLQILYAGRIKMVKDAFQYSVYRKKEILELVDNYFNKYPLKSAKAAKINLIKDFYQLETYPKTLDFDPTHYNIKRFKDWIIFKNKWEKL